MINKEVIVFQIEDMLSNINKENLLANGGYIENGTAFLEMMTNVLTLLKEREPMKPTWSQGKAYCGNCGQRLPRKCDGIERQFCSFCGQAVRWE